MKQDEYNRLRTEFDDWYAKILEYCDKREKLVKDGADDKMLDDLDKRYGQTSEDALSGSSSYWGPTVMITELEDLKNQDFKLPGIDRSFLELKVYPEIISNFGKTIKTERHGDCKIIGFMYDSSDYYILVEELDTGKVIGVYDLK